MAIPQAVERRRRPVINERREGRGGFRDTQGLGGLDVSVGLDFQPWEVKLFSA